MPTYVVSAEQHHTVEKDDKTNTIKSITRYKRGDEITMEEGEAQRLLKTGGLMTRKDYDATYGKGARAVVATSTGFATVDAVETPEPVRATPAALSGQTAEGGLTNPDKSGGASKPPKG